MHMFLEMLSDLDWWTFRLTWERLVYDTWDKPVVWRSTLTGEIRRP